MQRYMSRMLLLAAVLIAGCGAPAEVKTNADAIPTILPGRSAPKGNADAAAEAPSGGRVLAPPR